jgi:hypothetical protein
MSCPHEPFEYIDGAEPVRQLVAGRWYHALIVGTTPTSLQDGMLGLKSTGPFTRQLGKRCVGGAPASIVLVKYRSNTNAAAIHAAMPFGTHALISTANGGLSGDGDLGDIGTQVANLFGQASASASSALSSAGSALGSGFNSASGGLDTVATIAKIAALGVLAFGAAYLYRTVKK